MKDEDKRCYWLDKPANVTHLYRGLWCVGIVLLLFDFVVHKHEDVALADSLFFYGIFGFVACVVLVVSAKGLRRLLMRREDYYS